MLHFDSTGKLVEAPIPTPNVTNLKTLNGQDPLVIGHRGASGVLPEHTLDTDFPATGAAVVDSLTNEFVRSPQNPDLGDALPNLASSRGFEGMAFSPDRSTLYPLLEGTVDGDPENSLRIYQFDVASSSFTGLVGYYPTTEGNPIGDFTPINDTEFLVIERDGKQGAEAEFKKIFKIDISNIDENGFVEKTEVVDLLNIADPDDLNGDGNTTFDFPFETIEDIVVIDENTILVAKWAFKNKFIL